MIAALYPSLLPTQAELSQMAATMSSPPMVAMMGNVYGMENLSQASVMTQECLIWLLVTAAIMNIFLVNRHTRVDEELGRLEMIRAFPVGRLTGSFAAVTFALIVNVITSVLTALLLIAVNIGGITAGGAFTFGFAIGATGFVFAGLTLLLAQLFSGAHGVTGAGFGFLGLFYIMRAVGDVRGSALSGVSPFGLALRTEAFYSNSSMPLIVLFVEGAVLAAAALGICIVRDHGGGLLPARKGKASASRFLRSPLGLAWRLSKGGALGWGAGLFLLGASYGSVCADINSFVESNEMMKTVIGAGAADTILDNYVAFIFVIMSMVVSVPVIMTSIRINNEERRGRLEQVYGRAVRRAELYGSFILLTIIESVFFELLLAVGLGAASGGRLAYGELIAAGFSYLPAIWVMAGLAILLTGVLPKLTSLVWAAFGYTFIILYMGRVMDSPEWVTKTTPFGNIPQLPVQEFTIVPLAVLTLIAAVLAFIGVRCYKSRDYVW